MSSPAGRSAVFDPAGARVVVVGAARSGTALTRFLLARGASVVLTDRRPAEALGAGVAALGRSGAELRLGRHDEATFLRADLIAVSPGVPMNAPPLAAARRRGIRIVAEVELASWFIKGIVIGITGTNGKSTTTSLTAHLLREAGLEAEACGNLGTPLVEALGRDAPDRHYVVELSSFQLEGIESFRPRIAVLLNLSPDHQDRYARVRDYYDAKARIFMNQAADDEAVLNRDDPEVRALAAALRARVRFFSSRDRDLADGAFLDRDAIVLRRQGRDEAAVPIADVPLAGLHNLENVMASLLVADLCGVPAARAASAVGTFRGLPHRLERVAEIDGVVYYNDSKATNVGATARALASLPGPIVLILGGRDKGGAFEDLAPLVRERVSHLVLMGEARDALAARLGSLVPTSTVGEMGAAIEAARRAAAPGATVLLAPACASFDQYDGFESRGDDFRRRVAALRPAGGGPPAGPGRGE
jgi:UDP-N-acetylmuramoylalanine--D-glutamate ligase